MEIFSTQSVLRAGHSIRERGKSQSYVLLVTLGDLVSCLNSLSLRLLVIKMGTMAQDGGRNKEATGKAPGTGAVNKCFSFSHEKTLKPSPKSMGNRCELKSLK